jgi:ADP-ribose pyrophosphatase YjhB (NUDIX family)
MMRVYHCDKGCCLIQQKTYESHLLFNPNFGRYLKAGVFMYDPDEKSVLLVQSRGYLWGLPKGTFEDDIDKNLVDCAIRELKEETGLTIKAEEFRKVIKVKNRATYFYTERKSCSVSIQDGEENDANGIAWIKIDCLIDCINNGQIFINQHCRIAFKKFLGVVLPSVDFVKVNYKKRYGKRPKDNIKMEDMCTNIEDKEENEEDVNKHL